MPGQMSPKFDNTWNKAPYLAPLCLLAASAILFLPGLGSRDFWAPGEPRYGEVIRVMFEKGDWLVPTLNGQLFADKPVLYYWLALIVSHLTGGVSEWTSRLPAALAGIGLVLLTYEFGRVFFDRQVGFFAALILATTYRVIWESRFLRLDTVLSFFLFFGFYLFLRAFTRRGPKFLYLCSYVCFALATLTKGPIGLALPALAIVSILIVTRKWRELREMRLITGFFVVTAVLTPWLLLLHLNGQDRWVSEFIWVHNVQNYALEPLGHVRPFYYYFVNLPADFLPWTLLIPGALMFYYPWRERLSHPATLALVCWFTAIFVFFTLSKSKIAYYLLPLLPAVALLAGCYLRALASAAELRGAHWLCSAAFLYLFGTALLLGGLALPFVTHWIEKDLISWSIPMAVFLAMGGLGTVFFLRQKKILSCFWTLTATILCAVLLSATSLVPHLNKYKSPRPLGEFVKLRIPPAVPVYVYQSTMDDFNFYAGRETLTVVVSMQQVDELRRGGGESYLLINEKDLSELHFNDPRQVAEQRIGDRKWYLLKLS
jgi:4-amino-4-deoxy-L-arabinose transferase-like glycosyltransferase